MGNEIIERVRAPVIAGPTRPEKEKKNERERETKRREEQSA